MDPCRIPPKERIRFFFGDNLSLIREKIEGVSSAFLGGEAIIPTACERYSLGLPDEGSSEEEVFSRLIESLQTPPIFSNKKIVLIDIIGSRSTIPQNWKRIFEIAAAASNSIYTIISTGNEWDLQGVLPLESYTTERCFQTKDAGTLKARALEKIRKSGKRIQQKDLNEWISFSQDENEFWQNLGQVLLRVGSNIEINRAHLEPYLNFEYENDNFAFTNALATRDLPRMLSLLHQSVELEGEVPQIFLGRLVTFYLQLKAFRSLLERIPFERKRFSKDKNGIYNFPVSFFDRFRSEAREGVERELLAKHPYVLKVFFTAALEYENSSLELWQGELEGVDSLLKTASIEPKYLLEGLLVHLMS